MTEFNFVSMGQLNWNLDAREIEGFRFSEKCSLHFVR